MFPKIAARILQLSLLGSVIAAFPTALFAGQTYYTVGVSADVTGGVFGPDLNVQNLSQTDNSYPPFLGTYPSISFRGRGEHTTLDSMYGFGYNRNFSDPAYETKSHSASLAFSAQLGPKWRLNLNDQFSMTSDISTYRLLSGDSTSLDQFQYGFTPVFLRSNKSNTAGLELARTFNIKSSLSLSGSYSTLDYPEGSLTTRALSDQKRIAAIARYTYTGERNTWSVGYSGAQFNFASFQDSRNHSAIFGYSHKFSPVLSLRIDIGPSYLESLEEIKSPVGANVTVALDRKLQKGSFTVSVSQTGGDTSGLGSVSNYRDAEFSMTRTFGKNITLSAEVSAFDSEGLQLNSVSARGISAGARVEHAIARDWSLNWGGLYQHYQGYSDVAGYDQKRLFVTLRYSKPELWRFSQ